MMYLFKRLTSGTLIATMLMSMVAGIPVAMAADQTASAVLSPSTVTTNQTQTYQLVVTNTTQGQAKIQSIGVNIPAGFTILSAIISGTSPTAVWTVSTSTFPGRFDMEAGSGSNDSLGEGESVTMTFAAKAPSTASSSAQFTVEAVKNANLGNSGPGATFTTSNQPTITVIQGVNTAPVADDQSVSTDEDTAQSVTLTATDANDDTLVYSIVAQPTNGTLSGTAPNVTYTPNVNYSGSDSFTFKANDGTVDSNVATVSITVDAVNDLPVASSTLSLITNQDTAISSALFGFDVEGATLTYAISSAPTLGTISDFNATTGAFTYTPNASSTGSDSFTFTVHDGVVASTPAIVGITILAVNHAPVAFASAITTDEDTATSSTLSGIDSDGNAITYEISSNPAHGALSGFNALTGAYTYTPTSNYNGSDSFTFTVNDGTVDSNVATVSIVVTSVNDVPVLGDINDVTSDEGSPVAFTASGSDADEGTLAYSLSGDVPAGATINPSTGEFSWTPTETQNGTHTFSVVVSDGQGGQTSQSVTFTINEVNSTPTVQSIAVSTQLNAAKTITLLGADSDIPTQTLTYAISTNPTNGTLGSISGNQVTYTPNENYTGSDTFTYTVSDGVVSSSEGTVTITTGNDTPALGEVSNQTVAEGSLLSFTVTASDQNEDPLTFSLSGDVPAGATINPSTGEFSWVPTEEQGGTSYTFSIQVTDGNATDSKSITITVTEGNTSPVADDFTGKKSFATLEDTLVSGTLTGTDTDTPVQTLSFATSSNPANGTFTSFDTASGVFTYVPNLNYNGTDSFTFVVNDGTANSEVATATIVVSPVNDAPVLTLLGSLNTVVLIGTATSSIELGATASDVEDGDITEGINRTGTFDVNTLGTYELTYSVYDSSESFVQATRTITVVAQPVVSIGGGGAGGSNGVPGCRDPKATNYDPTAVYDGACTYPQVLGASTSTVSIAEVPATQGEVLGASTSSLPLTCGEYLTLQQGVTKKALREGAKNDAGLVVLLQRFLNEHLTGTDIPVTGFFGRLTTSAVRKFQTENKDQVLTPWKLSKPTGIVYVTTVAHINNIKCPMLNIKVTEKELVPARN
jgi:hypothetical protein